MPDFYATELTLLSRRLMESIKEWAVRRNGVTLIGGWAVHEWVEPGFRQASRDVDLVLHDAAALEDFANALPRWRLAWKPGRPTDGIGCRHLDDASQTLLVDVFLARSFPYDVPGVPKPALVKTVPSKDFLPSLEWLLRDKILSVPNRQGPDAYEKQAKDLLDIHALVFHNAPEIVPRDLLRAVTPGERREAASRIEANRKRRPEFETEYRALERWLRG